MSSLAPNPPNTSNTNSQATLKPESTIPPTTSAPSTPTNAKAPKIGRFKRSWLLTRSAWQAFMLDKEMIALPIISLVVIMTVMTAYIVLFIANPGHVIYSNEPAQGSQVSNYAFGIIVGLSAALLNTIVTAALIHAALERFRGNNPSVRSSLKAAWQKIGPLASFALFSFTIGYIISQIASRIPFFGGKIVAWLAGAAWNVASFFAIPVIMDSPEPIGPIDATKQSMQLIKKVWGESLIAGATTGIMAFLSILTGIVVMGALMALASALTAASLLLGVLVFLSVIGILGMVMVFAVLNSFVLAAVYYYAVTGQSPLTFNQQLMQQAFTAKKARKVFGF